MEPHSSGLDPSPIIIAPPYSASSRSPHTHEIPIHCEAQAGGEHARRRAPIGVVFFISSCPSLPPPPASSRPRPSLPPPPASRPRPSFPPLPPSRRSAVCSNCRPSP